ncbi:MAG: sulfur oxidation c-type cytochrome SoxX [Betaproteobacteria bacterium]|nr:sulfur oxidation c-type cytochrome SoxX [Betaproteobacteria bacterium]
MALASYAVDGLEIRSPLGGAIGDAARGRAIATSRTEGACVLCHAVPGERFAGDIGPPLAGIGERLTPAQLRLRIVDSSRINPATVMPPYYRVDGLAMVAAARRGQPVLQPQEIEDVVAWLSTLIAPIGSAPQ